MELHSVDLNLLTALDALLTEQSVTRAAARLSIGQPAMSAALARLRKHFNDPLFVRDGRGLVATPLAVSLTDQVRVAVEAVKDVLGRSSEFDPNSDERTFIIVASDYVLVVLLRRLIEVLKAEAPEVQIHVVPTSTPSIDLLRRGQADFVVLPAELILPHFTFPSSPLFEDRFVLVTDAENREIGERVSLEEFVQLSFVSYDLGPPKSLIDEMLGSYGIRPHTVVSTQSFAVAPFLLRDTRLASIVHEKLAREFLTAARLRIIELPVTMPPIHERLFWNPSASHDRAHLWLRKRLIRLADEYLSVLGAQGR